MNDKPIHLLVLGVGGNVSQGIIKAIRKTNLNCNIIGACVDAESLGLYFCDKAYLVPYANDEHFLSAVIDICNNENIDMILTGVEENIISLSRQMSLIKERTKALFIASPHETLAIGQDKLKTSIWLKENGCNYPKYALNTDRNAMDDLVNDVGFPLIAKPIHGKGSKGIVIVNDNNDLKKVEMQKDYLLQEYIGDEKSEYTVGCYRDKKGNLVRPIIMHRHLEHGMTVKAEIIEDESILKEVNNICGKLDFQGPLNIQLRKNKNGIPICFELNVRFSGTTPMRAHFGFNDVEAMVREYLFNEAITDYINYKKGKAYRYMTEIYFEDSTIEEMQERGYLDNIKEKKIFFI